MSAGRWVVLTLIIVTSLSLSGGYLIAMAWSKPKPPERHHMYYCIHPQIPIALPCRFRTNTPVDV
jgi:hypothetical protein